MSDLSREAQAIIDAARDSDAPTTADRERIRAALVAKIGVPGLGTGAVASAGGNGSTGALMNAAEPHATSYSAATAGGAGKGALAAKILVGVLVIGGLGYGGYLLFGGERDDEARQTTEVQRVAVAEEAPPADTAPAQPVRVQATPEEPAADTAATAPGVTEPEAPPPAAAVKRPRANGKKRARKAAADTTATGDPLANLREEKKLISKAKEVLDDGNPSLAMKVLDRHAARFPDGVLAQDRAGLRVLALCELGEVERARRDAERFLERWPRAPMAHRVRSACAEEDP
jgi:hypothetical protein